MARLLWLVNLPLTEILHLLIVGSCKSSPARAESSNRAGFRRIVQIVQDQGEGLQAVTAAVFDVRNPSQPHSKPVRTDTVRNT
jgi:hypothetical protein